MKKLFLIVCLGCCLLACQQGTSKVNEPGLNPRIINGNPVDWSEAPQLAQINIFYQSGELGQCTGFAIDPDSFLTAAHCFSGDLKRVSVKTVNEELEALELKIAPGFRPDLMLQVVFNDLALVITKPHALPLLPILQSLKVVSSEALLVLGFGLAENNGFGILKSGEFYVEQITPNHIVSRPFSGKEANPCFGDSGAPVLKHFNREGQTALGVVALVSTGTLADCMVGDQNFLQNLQEKAALDFILTNAPGAVVF